MASHLTPQEHEQARQLYLALNETIRTFPLEPTSSANILLHACSHLLARYLAAMSSVRQDDADAVARCFAHYAPMLEEAVRSHYKQITAPPP